MLYWAGAFFMFALIAGFLGFGEPSATAAIWKMLFYVALVLSVLALVAGFRRRHPPLN